MAGVVDRVPPRGPAPVPNYGIDADRPLARESLVTGLGRRIGGRYSVDEFGGDPQLQDLVLVPALARLPVRVVGAEHLPRAGAALLVANPGLGLVEPLVLSAAVQRAVGRRLRVVGAPRLPVVGPLTHKLGAVGPRAGDVAAVLRAGHLAAVPLARRWLGLGSGEAPRGVIAAALAVPVVPVAITAGPGGVPLPRWTVRIGVPLAAPDGARPGDPLAAAELAADARGAIEGMLRA